MFPKTAEQPGKSLDAVVEAEMVHWEEIDRVQLVL
jgi:hypothetical protein